MRRVLLLCLLINSVASAQELYPTAIGISGGNKQLKINGAFSDGFDFARNIRSGKDYEYLGLQARFGIGEKNRFRTSFSVYDDLAPRNFEFIYSRLLFSGLSVLAGFHKYDLLFQKDYFVDYKRAFPGFAPFYPADPGGYYFSTLEYFTGAGYHYSRRHWEINAEVHVGVSDLKAPDPGSQYFMQEEEVYKVDLKLHTRPELLTAFHLSAGVYPFPGGRLGLQARYRLSANTLGLPSYERTIYHWTADHPQQETVHLTKKKMTRQDLDFGLIYRF